MNAEELIRLQLELECKGVTEDGLLVRAPGPDPDDIARVCMAQYDGGSLVFFRYDLPQPVRERLKARLLVQDLADPATLTRLLGEYIGDSKIGRWKTYIFPSSLTPADYSGAIQLGEIHRALAEGYDPKLRPLTHTTCALLVAGQIVSTCESARESAHAGEAWVRTRPEFRRRGYARRVTAAWAHSLQMRGQVPFYSHAWDNAASEALAHSLGLIHVFDLIVYE